MQILDYNRVVKDLNGLSEEKFLKSIESSFSIITNPSPLTPVSSYTFSMFLNEQWYRLEAKDHIISNDPIEGLDAPWQFEQPIPICIF